MLVAAHLVGPMWSVDGHPVVVPAGDSAPPVVMAYLASVVVAPGPWPVRVTDGDLVLDLMLGVDGSVTEPPAKPAMGDRWWRR
jgi:hypothetical protein